MSTFLRSTFARYSAAIVFTSIALGLKLLLVPLVTEDVPFLLFFGAVMASAAYGGFGPGLLATILAAIFHSYFFDRPNGRFELSTFSETARVVLFMVESIFICVLCAWLKSALQRADDNAAEARKLEGKILEISEAEQRRIGHDLHDGLGQHLTGIALIMQRLGKRLTSSGAPDAEEAMKVSNMAKTAVEWTHDLCRTLATPALESSGLAEALRELAANAENIFSIECTFDQTGDEHDIELTAGMHLYRIAQEAISNAVRHGAAKHVQIALVGSPRAVDMQIADDGRGINETNKSLDGMGLQIMRYRARMIGATMDVRPQELEGTIVTCHYVLPRVSERKESYVNN
jgi:signal transduction histidine kinase